MLDLRNNPLVERGEGDTLGWLDLRERLEDRVVLSQNELAGPVTVINEDDVYRRLREDTLHWNIQRHDSLSSKASHPIHSPHNLLARHAPPTTDRRDMASYIKTVYGIDKNAFRGWRMYTESLSERAQHVATHTTRQAGHTHGVRVANGHVRSGHSRGQCG
eukprot:jgi/Antlo1/1732/1129